MLPSCAKTANKFGWKRCGGAQPPRGIMATGSEPTGWSVLRTTGTPPHYRGGHTATLVEKMLSSIIYCHHHGVVHRDIKLDNFIYENEREDAELKLIDFGFAAEILPGKESMWDQLGTPSYMAPELWGSEEAEYDSSVDMWALGVVTYMLLSGKRPFHSNDKEEKRRMIMHDPLRFPTEQWGEQWAQGTRQEWGQVRPWGLRWGAHPLSRPHGPTLTCRPYQPRRQRLLPQSDAEGAQGPATCLRGGSPSLDPSDGEAPPLRASELCVLRRLCALTDPLACLTTEPRIL